MEGSNRCKGPEVAETGKEGWSGCWRLRAQLHEAEGLSDLTPEVSEFDLKGHTQSLMGLLSLSLLLVIARQFTYHKTHLFKVIHSKVFFLIRTLKIIYLCLAAPGLRYFKGCSLQPAGLPPGCSAQAYHCSSFHFPSTDSRAPGFP